MTIKGKLITILVLIGTILGLLAGIVIWSYKKNIRQVQLIGPALGDLYAARKVRANISQQMKDLMDYILSGNDKDAMTERPSLLL